MELKRLIYRMQRGVPLQVTTLLKCLGVDYSCKKKGHRKNRRDGYWLRNEHQHYEILAEAKRAHRNLIKRAHPDKGGCPKVCAFINAVWDRIQLLFKRKGIELCD